MTSLMTIMEDYFAYRNFKYLRLDGETHLYLILLHWSVVRHDFLSEVNLKWTYTHVSRGNCDCSAILTSELGFHNEVNIWQD